MDKFVKITQDGDIYYINVSKIISLRKENGRSFCVLYLENNDTLRLSKENEEIIINFIENK